jgi:nucleoside-diphosphate-sugar epimerase
VYGDYTNRQDLDSMLQSTGAKKLFAITDYFLAAGKKFDVEVAHGRAAIDAAKAANVNHFVFCSVIDAEQMPDECHHIKSKIAIEQHLKSSGLKYSILRPCCFFENLDDAQNWNPLKKGSLKFILDQTCTWCGTYDIGRAAAAHFKNPSAFLGQTLDVVSYQGDLSQVAKALEKVGGVPVTHGLAMPMCLRGLILGQDLHQMCNYFQDNGGVPRAQERIAAFKQVVPSAFSAEDWFRFHNRYGDGSKIVS